MGAHRTLKQSQGQALVELLLLAPLFLAILLALLFFIKTMNARLTVIHVCRDMALELGRAEDASDPQALLQALVQRRGVQAMGQWKAEVQAAVPGGDKASTGLFNSILGSLIAERLTVTLKMPLAPWMALNPGLGTISEHVAFKRGTWKAPFAKAIESLMNTP